MFTEQRALHQPVVSTVPICLHVSSSLADSAPGKPSWCLSPALSHVWHILDVASQHTHGCATQILRWQNEGAWTSLFPASLPHQPSLLPACSPALPVSLLQPCARSLTSEVLLVQLGSYPLLHTHCVKQKPGSK